MVCVPKKISMVPKISRWYPKLWPKWSCGQFFDLKNDEKSSFEKMCQGVRVPIGYHFGYRLGTIRHFGYHFGYHYNEFLKTKKSIFWDFPHLQAFFGCRMVPKVVPEAPEGQKAMQKSSKRVQKRFTLAPSKHFGGRMMPREAPRGPKRAPKSFKNL